MSEHSVAATSGPNEVPAMVKQTIVASLEAPRLTDILTEAFAVFKEQRTTYERQVDENNSDPGTQIVKTTCRNSVDQSVLDVFVMAQWVPVTSVDEITEQHIKECVENRAEISVQDFDAGKIEQDIRGVKMEAADRDTDLEKQVWLCLKYTNTLRKCGYKEFITKRPRQAVKHVSKTISHHQLRDRMRTVLGTEQDELKNDFHGFIRMLASEARNIEKLEYAKFYVASVEAADSSDSDIGIHKPGSQERRKNGRRKITASRRERIRGTTPPLILTATTNRHPKNEALLLCRNLLTLCARSIIIKDCPITADADKKRLKEEYQQNKRKKRSGKVGKLGASEDISNDRTSLFSATFFDGAVETVAMADQGSDANVIFPSLLRKLQHASPSLVVRTLENTVIFCNALATAKPIRCSRTVQATIRLRNRHGCALSISNIKRFVAEDELDCVYIGRHVLLAIGLDNKKHLTIACDRYNGHVDIAEKLEKAVQQNSACTNTEAGSIRSLLRHNGGFGSSYHSIGYSSNDGLGDTDFYVDLGEDTPEELDAALKNQIATARANGLSAEGCAKLEQLLVKYWEIFECGWENLL